MDAPKVELKNLKFFMGMENQGFNANLYINGLKCAFVIDEGNGGCLNYQPYLYKNPKESEVKKNMALLENYIKTMPKVKTEFGDIKMDMDLFIEELINQKEKEKQDKKKVKLMETSFLFGVPNGDSFRYIQFKKPLAELARTNKALLQAKLLEYKSKYCKKGVVLLNTNLEKLGLVV